MAGASWARMRCWTVISMTAAGTLCSVAKGLFIDITVASVAWHVIVKCSNGSAQVSLGISDYARVGDA